MRSAQRQQAGEALSGRRTGGKHASMKRRVLVIALLSIILSASAMARSSTPAAAYPLGEGYWTVASDGGIFAFGEAQFFGSTGDIRLNKPIVGAAATPFLEGYWLVASDGGIFTFGSAGFFGSTGSLKLKSPIVGMAAHPHGLGYWLVASDGGIFSFGDAGFFGSAGNLQLNRPIVGMASTPSGNGYWLVATDGGIFTFGDADFFGSTGDIRLNKPIVGMESTPSGRGYYMVASDGGIFTFGDAVFHGSTGDIKLNSPVIGMARSRSGRGYQLVATDGGIFNFGDSKFFGSTGAIRLNQPVLGMALRPPLGIKVDAFGDTASQASHWSAIGGDERLVLNHRASGPPAGARVFGVEGLEVAQLGVLRFTLEAGPCDSSPAFALFYDTNRDGAGDASRQFPCSAGGAGAVKSFDPLAAGIPGNAVVTALDVWHSRTGTTARLDDIVVAGLTVGGTAVARAA